MRTATFLLQQYLDAVMALIDGPTGIGFCCCEQTWRLSLDAFPATIRLPVDPVDDSAEIAITYLGTSGTEATLDAADFRLSGGIIAPAFGKVFPATLAVRGAVNIEFVAGVAAADVPADIKLAIMQVVSDWFANREMAAAGKIAGSAQETFDRYRFGWISA